MPKTGAERTRAYRVKKRKQAREAGLCYTCCKQKPDPGRSVCAFCNAANVERKKRRQKRDREATEFQHIIAAHEYSGDVARKNHLYADAAQRYLDALNISVIVPSDRSRISTKLAEALSLGHDPGAANPWYDHLLISYQFDKREGAENADLFGHIARQFWLASNTEASVSVLEQAIRSAELRKDTRTLRSANIALANALICLDRHDETERCLNAVDSFEKTDSMEMRVRYYRLRGFLTGVLGERKEAFANFEEALSIAQEDVSGAHAATVLSDYALIATILGQTDLAKMHRKRALYLARQSNVTWLVSRCCLSYAELLARMGQHSLAYDCLHDALSYDAKAPLLDQRLAAVGIPLALRMNDNAMLAKCAKPHVIEPAFLSGESARIGDVAAAFVQFYIRQGHLQKAKTLIHRAIVAMREVIDTWDLPLAVARYGIMGDIALARQLLERRIARPHASVAEAQIELFDAFVAQREKRMNVAHRHAREAMRRFDTLKWYAYAELARAVLLPEQRRTVEVTTYAAPSTPATVLTSRELQIATLVVKGLTNRAIAAELSISENTVETHMASIMSRFGIRSRHQLVGLLSETEK